MTDLYTPQSFFDHAALLRQAFAHCAKFPTAASRRSLGRISVPMWLAILSDQLPVIALVGRYPANKLIGRRLIFWRPKAFTIRPVNQMEYAVLAQVSLSCPPPEGRLSTCYSPVRHSCFGRSFIFTVRLACLRRAASVSSEPGSNSPLCDRTEVRLHWMFEPAGFLFHSGLPCGKPGVTSDDPGGETVD